MAISDTLRSALFGLLAGIRLNAEDYCDVINSYGTDTLVFNDGSMFSMLRFNGFESVVEWKELSAMLNHIAIDLNELFLKQGYELIFRFSREENDNDKLARIISRKVNTAERMQMDLSFVLEEQYDSYADTVYKEYAYIGLVTRPVVLDKLDKTMQENKESKGLEYQDGMHLEAGDSAVYGKHITFVEKVLSTLDNPDYYINVEKLDVVSVLRIIREQIYMDGKSEAWLPDISIKDFRFFDLPHEYQNSIKVPYLPNPDDVSHIVPTSLGGQLLQQGFEKMNAAGLPSNTIKVGNTLFLSTMARTAPKIPSPFNDLFVMLNKVLAKDENGDETPIPYAVTISLVSASRLGLKEMLGSFIGSFGDQNRSVYDSLRALHQMSSREAVVGLKMSVMTWAKHTPIGIEALKERYLRVSNAFESWGGITLQHFSGDDIIQWRNNILGLSNTNSCPTHLAPLSEALHLMAWQRPLSPFGDAGSVVYRSVDGKLLPFELTSELTSDQHMIVTGTKGSGKSVFLSNYIFEHVVSPKNQLIPKILVVDVGFSSQGVVEMVRNALPKELAHRAVARSMKNNKATAINFMDIKVGLNAPTDSERTIICGFLQSLLTPKERPMGLEGMSDLVPVLVDEAYKFFLGREEYSRPKMFSTEANYELTNLLVELKPMEFDVITTQTETGQLRHQIPNASVRPITSQNLANLLQELGNRVNDEMTRAKYYRARDLAWRLAMPTVEDLITIAQDQRLADLFKHHTETGDTFISRAVQSLQMAVRSYPCFCNITSFDVDSADIIVLDLQEVIDKNNPQHNSLFYQICLNLFGRYFKFQEGEMDRVVPPLYKEYYRQWDKDIQMRTKLLVIDEFANVQNAPVAMMNIEKAGLEMRKHGMKMILASQQTTHFEYNTGQRVINLLTTANYWVALSKPEGRDMEFAVNTYEIPHSVVSEMSNIRFKPKLGSVFYMFVKGKNKRYHQFLNFKLGAKMLWVCNTTPVDRTMRAVMLEIAANQREAVEALAYYFGTSASSRLKSSLDKIDEMKISPAEKRQRIQKLYEDMASTALQEYRSWAAKKRADEQYYERNRIDVE